MIVPCTKPFFYIYFPRYWHTAIVTARPFLPVDPKPFRVMIFHDPTVCFSPAYRLPLTSDECPSLQRRITGKRLSTKIFFRFICFPDLCRLRSMQCQCQRVGRLKPVLFISSHMQSGAHDFQPFQIRHCLRYEIELIAKFQPPAGKATEKFLCCKILKTFPYISTFCRRPVLFPFFPFFPPLDAPAMCSLRCAHTPTPRCYVLTALRAYAPPAPLFR